MFTIHSTASSRELVFWDFRNDYFRVELKGEVSATLDVYAYTDALGLSRFFAELAGCDRPWNGERSWSSLEGEFFISAICSSTGNVLFTVKLSGLPGAPEEWSVSAGIESELGQLAQIARSAALFFC